MATGVVFASYTWEDDAAPWDGLSEEDGFCVPWKLSPGFMVPGYTGSYHRLFFQLDPPSLEWGAVSLYEPLSTQNCFPCPHSGREGSLCRRHTSSIPGWIEGAIESGIWAAVEVNGERRGKTIEI